MRIPENVCGGVRVCESVSECVSNSMRASCERQHASLSGTQYTSLFEQEVAAP